MESFKVVIAACEYSPDGSPDDISITGWRDACGDVQIVIKHYEGTQETDEAIFLKANDLFRFATALML